MKNEPKISFDAALLLALQADAKREIEGLPTPKELKECYPDARKWDIRLKNARNGRKANVWKRLLVSVATCCMLFAGALAVNADFRDTVYTMFRSITSNELQITYQVQGETLNNLPEGYEEHYIPVGFELENYYENSQMVVHAYKNPESGLNCIVVYEVIQESGQTFTFGVKNSDYSIQWRNGVKFLQEEYEEENGYRSYTLFWESAGIAHTVMGEMEIDELYRIAESICVQ